VEDE
jgi:hypothetical protein